MPTPRSRSKTPTKAAIGTPVKMVKSSSRVSTPYPAKARSKSPAIRGRSKTSMKKTPTKPRSPSPAATRSGRTPSKSTKKMPPPVKRSASKPRKESKKTVTISAEITRISAAAPSSSAPSATHKNRVLSDETLDRLGNWKYHSGGATPLDNAMNHFWEFCVKLLPMNMAPNLVTFTGLIIVGGTASLLAYHDPKMNTTVPGEIYFIALVGHFLYQTFDAIDGKQARRTGTSSPLGQLFDHGCDAFITNVVGVFNASCMQYGTGAWTVLNTMLNFNVFFLAQWEEYHTGELKTNNGFVGLTEGQFAQFAMMLSVAVFGPESWQQKVSYYVPIEIGGFVGQILDMECRYAVLIPMSAVTLMLAAQALVRVLITVKQSNLKKSDHGAKQFDMFNTLGQMVPQYVMYYCGWKLTQVGHFQEQPLLLFFAWGVSCSFYTTQVIVAQMSKSPIDWANASCLIAAPMVVVTSYLGRVWTLGEAGVADEVVVYCWVGLLALQYLYYVGGVCQDLADHLGIQVFTI